MIPVAELSLMALGERLSNAGIEFVIQDDGHMWVEKLEYPFMIDLVVGEETLPVVQFITYAKLRGDVAVEEATSYIDQLNREFVLAQFYTFDDLGQLRASYAIPVETGLDPGLFMKIAETFPRIFHTVIHESVAATLIGDGRSQSPPSDNEDAS